jgi:hypothetical protein
MAGIIAVKNRSDNRVLVLETILGEKPLSSTGLVDPRLFTGENKLRAIKDPQTCMWSFKYDMGGLPPLLKDRNFTNFTALVKYARDYLLTRNIQIKEVID